MVVTAQSYYVIVISENKHYGKYSKLQETQFERSENELIVFVRNSGRLNPIEFLTISFHNKTQKLSSFLKVKKSSFF